MCSSQGRCTFSTASYFHAALSAPLARLAGVVDGNDRKAGSGSWASASGARERCSVCTAVVNRCMGVLGSRRKLLDNVRPA
jgi:hypothetical protein